MPTDPEMLSPMEAERRMRQVSRRRDEVVIYYRRPATGAMPGWIIWGDSQDGKRSDYVYRGFTPLPQFGRLDFSDPAYAKYGVWGPILTHPDGPAQFPAQQVMTFRWYSEEGLRASCDGRDPPRVKFPQLKGQVITEFACPECSSTSFLRPVGLARHLRNHHEYDRAEVIALGRELGVDFTHEVMGKGRQEFVYGYEEAEPEAPDPDLPTVEAVAPRGRREMTAEEKAAAGARLKAARERKRAERQAVSV
jgi:hypothetical protein